MNVEWDKIPMVWCNTLQLRHKKKQTIKTKEKARKKLLAFASNELIIEFDRITFEIISPFSKFDCFSVLNCERSKLIIVITSFNE